MVLVLIGVGIFISDRDGHFFSKRVSPVATHYMSAFPRVNLQR